PFQARAVVQSRVEQGENRLVDLVRVQFHASTPPERDCATKESMFAGESITLAYSQSRSKTSSNAPRNAATVSRRSTLPIDNSKRPNAPTQQPRRLREL